MLPSLVPPRRAIAIAALAIAAIPALAAAQSAADHIAMGDRDHAALNAPVRFNTIRKPSSSSPSPTRRCGRPHARRSTSAEYGAQAVRDSVYPLAEQYARRAVEANPTTRRDISISHARFEEGALGSAIGKFAGDVRAHALE